MTLSPLLPHLSVKIQLPFPVNVFCVCDRTIFGRFIYHLSLAGFHEKTLGASKDVCVQIGVPSQQIAQIGRTEAKTANCYSATYSVAQMLA